MIIPLVHISTACAGSVTAYLLRRIAYRAGAYAPGLHEQVFFDLAQNPLCGGSIDAVDQWFKGNVADLQQFGYRIGARRITEPTETVLGWVKAGAGFRGAVLRTTHRRLHPGEREDILHAVGIAVDRTEPSRDEELMMVDPWPGTKTRARDRTPIPANLELAHRDHKYQAMIFFWTGWL